MSAKFPYQLSENDCFEVAGEGYQHVKGVRWSHKDRQYEITTTTGKKVLCPIIRTLEVTNR